MDAPADALFPSTRMLTIRLDDNPAYRGSVHDDAVARRMGYRAALVPGAFLYGHVARVAAEAWGEAWLRRGRMGARFRRPAYRDDRLACTVSGLAAWEDGVRAEVTLRDRDGEEVVTGWVGLPDADPPAPTEPLPVLPLPDPPPTIEPGGLAAGLRLGSRGAVLTQADVAASRLAFDEHHPLFAGGGFVHPGCLIRLAMADANRSFRFPSAVVFVEGEARHHAAVRAGCRIETSGTVTAAYERRGRHYFESQETLLADGVVAARFRRVSIYFAG